MPSFPSLTLSTPADFAAVAAHVIGYQPLNEIAVAGICGTHLVFVGCARLPGDPADPGWRADTFEAMRGIRGLGCDRVMLAGYGHADTVGPALTALVEICGQAALPVAGVIGVDTGRFWPHPHQPGDPGIAVPGPDHPGVAALAVAGRTTVAGRSTVEARLALEPGDTAEHIATIIDMLPTEHAHQEAARILAGYRTPEQMSPRHAAVLLSQLHHTSVRDQVLVCVDEHPPGALLPLWEWLTRHAPPGYIAAPAAICAYAAWRAGDDLLARVALDRADTDRPGDDLADAVRHLLVSGVDPDGIPSAATLIALTGG